MWKLKDPEFKKKINAFFSDEEIADACNKDMGKSNGVVILSDYDYEEGNPEKRGIGIFIKKEHFEREHEYSKSGWNPFPEVIPPEDGLYIVSVKSLVGDAPHMMFLPWDHTLDTQWTDVIAFRQAPKPYRPPIQRQRWRIKDPQTRLLMSKVFGDEFVSWCYEVQKDNNRKEIHLHKEIAIHPNEPTVTKTIHTWVDKKDFESC